MFSNIKKIPRIRESPNLSTDAERRTDTNRNIRIFFFFRGFGLEGGAALHSTAEHWYTFYPSNYTALLSHAEHFTAKLKKIYIVLMNRNLIPWTALNFGE